jgi:hypothetical protein
VAATKSLRTVDLKRYGWFESGHAWWEKTFTDPGFSCNVCFATIDLPSEAARGHPPLALGSVKLGRQQLKFL